MNNTEKLLKEKKIEIKKLVINLIKDYIIYAKQQERINEDLNAIECLFNLKVDVEEL